MRIAHLVTVLAAGTAVGCGAVDEAPGDEAGPAVVSSITPVGEGVLLDVRDVASDGAGGLWALSSYEPIAHVFDPMGEVASFGDLGEGPDEYRSPRFFAGSPANQNGFFLWDPAARQIVHSSPMGVRVRVVSVPPAEGRVVAPFDEIAYGEPNKALSTSDGFVLDAYERNVIEPVHLWSGRLIFLDSEGVEIGTEVRFSDVMERDVEAEGFQLFEPAPLWTVCGDDRVAIVDSGSGRTRWYDSRGGFVAQEDLALPAREVEEVDVERYVQLRLRHLGRSGREEADTLDPQVQRETRETVAALLTQLPRSAPVMRLRCDPVNRLWMQLFGTEMDARGFGSEWVVSHSSGMVTVHFPEGFTPLSFGTDQIVGVATNSLEVEVAATVPYPPLLTPAGGGS